MKKKQFVLPLVLLATTLLFFVSCLEQMVEQDEVVEFQETNALLDNDNPEAYENGVRNMPENTISLATFNTWNTSWETHWNDKYISYFTMPLSNLQNLVNTPDVHQARLYLGYSENDGYPHLTLVGVDDVGESMLGTNDYIYNVTLPCPTLCGPRTPKDSTSTSPVLTNQPPHTISTSTFLNWTSNWESHWDDQYLKFFTMPLSNLQNLVNTSGVEAARFYFGYSQEDNYPHLLLVGVDDEGRSMINTNNNIYNFAKPCPVFCDPK